MEAGHGLLRIPQKPEGYRGIEVAEPARPWRICVWRGAGDACFQVLARRRKRAKVEPRRPEGIVGEKRERRVVGLLRHA